MTDKRTNDRTREEEMMDATFDSFDDDMGTQTQEETVESNAKEEKPKTKGSDNKKLFLLVGGAAVLVVGYMFAKPFIFGSDPQPQPAQPVAVNQPQVAPPVNNNVGNGQPVPVQTPNPVNPTPNPLLPANNQIDPAAANFLTGPNSGQNPLAGNRTVENMPQPTQPVVTPPVQVQQPVVNPVPVQQPQVTINTPTPVVVENTSPSNVTVTPTPSTNVGNGNNVVQAALIDELKGMFEKQTKEIKGSIDAVGDRVSVLEKSAEEQKEVNKSIEERLAKLEAGQTTKEEVEKAKAAETKKVAAAPAKKPVYKAPARKPAPQKAKESDVLVDKSETPRQAPVRATPQNNIQIHSVFAGRVWIKNADSSLSTYVAGEKLPTGEVIQRVDDSRGEIVTNRRVIK